MSPFFIVRFPSFDYFFFTIFLNPTLDKRVSELLQVKSLEDTFNTLSPGEFHKLNASYLIFAQERQENFLSNIFLVDIFLPVYLIVDPATPPSQHEAQQCKRDNFQLERVIQLTH